MHRYLALFVSCWLACGWAAALTLPEPIRLRYVVKGEASGIPVTLNGEMVWKTEGPNYELRLVMRHFLLGSRSQTSTGTLGPQGLVPLQFTDKERKESARFDWAEKRVHFQAPTPSATLQDQAQDQLSVLLQLAALLASHPSKTQSGTVLQFQAFSPSAPETWTFTVGALEQLKLPGGEVTALRLSRPAANPNDSQAQLWLAPSMGYLPVRIRLTQSNGDVLDQRWSGSEAP